MRKRSPLRWLAGMLWIWTVVAVFFVLELVLRDDLSLGYLRLSRTGVLITATIQEYQGPTYWRAVYSYATPDGVRHVGKARHVIGSPGDDILVFYLPGDPDTSTPRSDGLELLQLGVAVLAGLASATSLAAWAFRSRRPQ